MKLDNTFKVYFFMGKGGVGKTTCAAAFALQVAKTKKTLIISLDPAHNLGDVLGLSLGEEPLEVCRNLYAVEVDFEHMILKHLKNLTDKIKDIYGYLRIFNLDSYIDVLKHSPGIEEYATLDKITEVIKSNMAKKEYEVIVFDTPPTGLTLRIMALPSISSIWINKLIQLRMAILDRRRMVERITGEKIKSVIGGKVFEAPSEPKEDPIYNELLRIKDDVELVNSIFKNSKTTSTILIINPEILPILEARRALDFLKKLNIPVKYLIINKVLNIREAPESLKLKVKQQEEALGKARELFKELNIIEIPFLPREPKGLSELEELGRYISPLLRDIES